MTKATKTTDYTDTVTAEAEAPKAKVKLPKSGKAPKAASKAPAKAAKAPKAEKAPKAAKADKPSADEAKLLLRCRSLAAKLRHRVRVNRDNPGTARLTSMTDRPIMEGKLEEIAAHMTAELETKAAKKTPKGAAHAEQASA